MGALAMTGLACFGAAIAIGLIASAAPRTPGNAPVAPGIRGLAMILIAFTMGSAVLGVIVGLLTIFEPGIHDPTSGLLAVASALVGLVVGLGLMARNAGRADPQVSAFAALFIIGTAILAVVVAILAVFIPSEVVTTLANWPFVVLGMASAGATIAIGLSGAAALRSMVGLDDPSAKVFVAKAISRVFPFQAIGIGVSAVAIMLVVTA